MKESFEQVNNPGQKKAKLTPQMREMIFLAEQAGTGGIKVLPGTSWAYHYKKTPEERKEKLEGMLSGKYTAEQAEEYLKPDALVYDVKDLEHKGLDAVSARIMNETSMLAYYDYKKYGDFMAGLQGLSVTPEEASELYEELTKGRIQKSLRDALGSGGKKSLDRSLVEESNRVVEDLGSKDRIKKVIDTLKLDWLHEKMGVIDSTLRDRAISQLSGDEREIYNAMRDEYGKFVDRGDQDAYDKLVKQFKDGLPKLQKETSGGSESMKELEKELEEMEDVNSPGVEKDPAIPPEDNDEYHTPSGDKENQGKQEKGPGNYFFKIEPPLQGYYASGKKSYFDVDRKVWSKKKQTTEYAGTTFQKDTVYEMDGATKGGIVSIPLPTGYAIDQNTLKHKGEKLKILRDQNGCFYIETSGPSSFSFSFSKEEKTFVSLPIAEDTKTLYKGSLSQKTETFMSKAVGGSLQKAEQIRQHILANHFYPGGGDATLAQKLQAKLRNESTGDNYLQSLDTSEYLECYSANTKFVAMARKCGIPARLVVGHHVEGAQKGKSYIDSNNGHAWSEIWDGKMWRRFDATPPPKPEDKKDKDEKNPEDKQENAPDAKDDGVEAQGDQKPQEGDGKGEKSKKDKSKESSEQSDKPGEASDQDVEKGEEQLQQAEESIKQAEKTKQDTMEQIEKTDSFKDLEKLKEEIEKKDLLEEMKEALEEAIEAKENMMKEDLKEQLEQMSDDGFLEDEERKKLLEKLLEESGQTLDQLQKQIEEGNTLYIEYQKIKEEIEPLVEEWFKYFAEKLPRQKEVSLDEDSLSRQGAFDRRSVNRTRNILFGTVKNPRIIESTIKPLFLASIMVDVSGSMGDNNKLKNAQKLLIFYSELFTKIKEEFGYINFAINTFSDSMQEIKTYDQDYDSPQAYVYPDNTRSTVKVRLMKNIKTQGGTNMLDPIKRASKSLSEQAYDNPDYASSFYFLGDGEDTNGNSERIKQFLLEKDKEGFGSHMLSAILLGSQREREALSKIFGEEHTTVAGDFDELIKESMDRFDEDIEEYLRGKAR